MSEAEAMHETTPVRSGASDEKASTPALTEEPKVTRKRGAPADEERQRKLPRNLDSVASLVMASLGGADQTGSGETKELVWDALQTTELRLAMGSFFTEPSQPKAKDSSDTAHEDTPTE